MSSKDFTSIDIVETPVLSISISKLTTDDVILSTVADSCLYSLKQMQFKSETDTVWARLTAGD